jgi:hypothetical protein
MKKLLIPASLALLFAWAPPAQAGSVLFGTDEAIHFVADTPIQSPAGRLYLGHRVRTHAFLLPFHVESKGLVFGVAGEPGKFIAIPPAQELASLQSAGLLPKELPQPRLGLLDYATGYSLELVLLVVIGIFVVRRKSAARRKRAR